MYKVTKTSFEYMYIQTHAHTYEHLLGVVSGILSGNVYKIKMRFELEWA